MKITFVTYLKNKKNKAQKIHEAQLNMAKKSQV